MLKNFIFDVDRTLVNSYNVELSTLKEALFIVTNTLYTDDVMNELSVLPTNKFFTKLGIDPASDTMKLINRHWGRLLQNKKIEFFVGMKEVLVELKNNDYFLAIVTSRTKEELEELESLMEIIDLFDIIVTADVVNKPKPDPESINVIVEEKQLNREETIYIGDSKSDLQAAKAANVKFGYAKWDVQADLTGYDYLLNSPQAIYKLMK